MEFSVEVSTTLDNPTNGRALRFIRSLFRCWARRGSIIGGHTEVICWHFASPSPASGGLGVRQF